MTVVVLLIFVGIGAYEALRLWFQGKTRDLVFFCLFWAVGCGLWLQFNLGGGPKVGIQPAIMDFMDRIGLHY